MADIIQTGFYKSYLRSGQRLWLLPNMGANIVIVAIGIFVAIALARLWRIFSRVYNLSAGWTWLDQAPAYFASGDKETPDLDNSIESEGFHRILRARVRYQSFPEAIDRSPADEESRSLVRRDLWIGSFLLCLYIGFSVCGVLTTQLQTDSLAPSRNPDCGIWTLNKTNETRGRQNQLSRPVEFEKQSASIALAEQCYDAPAKTDGCSYFFHSSIKVESQMVACPFNDMCYEEDQAFEMITPPIDAKVFGINAPKTLEVRRRAVCSPLKMDDRYIQRVDGDDGVHTFFYRYGRSAGIEGEGNASFLSRIYGNYIPDIAGYDIFVLRSDLGWKPLNSLKPPSGSLTTLIFVSSGLIHYDTMRVDPIFPATSPTTIGNLTYYRNTRGFAGVIGCTESTQLRDPSMTNEWTNAFDLPDPINWDSQSRGGFYMLRFGLVQSSIYQAAFGRSGDLLDAQKRLFYKVSLPLADEQWKVEVFKLFQISLARIQIEIRDIARGVGANISGYIRNDPADAGVDLCQNTYMFFSRGYQNINLAGYFTVWAISSIIILLAVPANEEELSFEVVGNFLFGSSTSGGHGILIRFWEFLCKRFRRAGKIFVWLMGIIDWLQRHRHWVEEWAFRRRS